MEVGCCDNLTGTADASEHLDAYKKRAERLKRFVSSPRWKAIASDVLAIKQSKIKICIVKSGSGFAIVMDGAKGKANFNSVLDAKMRVFEVIDTGEAAKFLAARKLKIAAKTRGRRQY